MDATAAPAPDPVNARTRMFDRVAARYDLLNHLLSLGQDLRWRRRAAERLCEIPDLALLDVATGTADQLLAVADAHPSLKAAVGVELSPAMLALARRKIRGARRRDRICLLRADAVHLPIRDASVQAASISFGIRNVVDVSGALRELRRVLVPGGRLVVLEFSLPRRRFIRAVYLFYFRHLLPRLGGWISGDRQAYSYLNDSAERFPAGDAFLALLREAGFGHALATPLSCGIVTLYEAEAA